MKIMLTVGDDHAETINKTKPRRKRGGKKFIVAVKSLPCVVCGTPGPSIYDHIFGSAKKLRTGHGGIERVHVGHYAGIPLCPVCDSVKTQGSRVKFSTMFGDPVRMWIDMIDRHGLSVPEDVRGAMEGELCS